MGKKIATDPKIIDALIVIYSFNVASISLLTRVLKLDEKTISTIFEQLTELGILKAASGDERTILLRKHEARDVMNAKAAWLDEVKYFEGIYQYQLKIQSEAPELIVPVETAIKASNYSQVVAQQREEYAPRIQKLRRVMKIMVIIVLVLGIFSLLLLTLPGEMKHLRESLFG